MTTAPDFTFAFQPIVNTNDETIFSCEALIRGLQGEPAQSVFSKIGTANLLEFDQHARNIALKIFASLKINCLLNINCMPGCLETSDKYVLETLDNVKENGLLPSQLVIEITENEIIHDYKKFIERINMLREHGIKVAIDDFGAGYSGLNLLVNFQPDMIKLDKELVKNIYSHGPRQVIVKALIQTCLSLGIDLIAEGVENQEEYSWLRKHGLYLFQGFLFAKPGLATLPLVTFPTF